VEWLVYHPTLAKREAALAVIRAWPWGRGRLAAEVPAVP
jgi:hypothetical protein